MKYTAEEIFDALVDMLDGTGWVEVSPKRFVIDVSGGKNEQERTMEILCAAAAEAIEREASRWHQASNGDGTHSPVALEKRRSPI